MSSWVTIYINHPLPCPGPTWVWLCLSGAMVGHWQHVDSRTEGGPKSLGDALPPYLPFQEHPQAPAFLRTLVSLHPQVCPGPAFWFFIMQIRWEHNNIPKIYPEPKHFSHPGTRGRAPACPTQGTRGHLAPLSGLPAPTRTSRWLLGDLPD